MAVTKPSVADVELIVGDEFADALVQAVIDDAALIVERCVENLDEDRQKAIIKWVAAHLLTTTPDGKYRTSQKLGDASESYAVPRLGDSLAGSAYGQQALLLDPNGCIARIGRANASIEVV